MSNIKRNHTEELIHAYVDNQLSPDEHYRFERLLNDDVELQNKVDSYIKQNDLLHHLYDDVLEEPLPDSLKVIPSVEKKQTPYLFKFAASVMLILIGGVLGWSAHDSQVKETIIYPNLAQAATMAHQVYAPEIKHPVEVSAQQEQHLIKWLSKRLGKNINAPSLIDAGFQLIGGRLLPSISGPAAQFMYEDNLGDRLTLFVRVKDSNEQNTAFRFYEEVETNSFYWIDGDLGYALVGGVDKEKLLDTANKIYQQLSF